MRNLFPGASALSLVLLCGLGVGAAAQESPDFKQGYAQGFKEGFDEGYRKATAEHGAAAAEASKGFTIAITGATYGPEKGNSCDARRFVAPRVNGRRSASVDVSNQMCGDPSPGNRKSLNVTYLCGNVPKTATAYEHRTAYLSCD